MKHVSKQTPVVYLNLNTVDLRFKVGAEAGGQGPVPSLLAVASFLMDVFSSAAFSPQDRVIPVVTRRERTRVTYACNDDDKCGRFVKMGRQGFKWKDPHSKNSLVPGVLFKSVIG